MQESVRQAEAEALFTLLRQDRFHPDAFVDRACERAREMVGADLVAILARAPGGGFAWLGISGNRTEVVTHLSRALGRGPSVVAISQERTVVFRRDGAGDGVLMGQLMDAESAETAMAVPLRSPAGPFGSLLFAWRTLVEVDAEQRQLGEALSDYVAIVLENSRAHSESERRREEAEALAELVRQGAAERQTDKVIQLICRQATELAGADYAGIRLVTDQGSLAWAGMWGNRSDSWRRRPATRGTGSASQALAAGHTVIIRTEEARAHGTDVEDESVRSSEGGVVVLATPLTYSGRKLGSLVCGWRTDIEPSAEQVRVAELLAGYGAAVIDNANSHAESERRRAEAEALANLVWQGAAEQELQHAINIICEGGRELLGADYATMSIVEGDHQRMWYGVSGMKTGPAPSRGRGQGATAQALAAGHAVVFEHIDQQADFSRFHTQEGGVTAIAAPSVGRRGLKGAIHFGWRSEITVTLSKLRMAEALAGYAAVVVENAQSHAALEERAEALAASEERYRNLSAELERRVLERTAELEAANRELEAFSYSVSHDLRAPLRSMDGFCQVLIEDYGDVLDSGGHEYLNRVRAASQRMAELIDGLLNLSRVTRTQITPEIVDLSAAAKSILSGLRAAEPERDITFVVQPGLTARGDSRLLKAVVDNLLRNAWKFTAKHPSAKIAFGATEVDGKPAFFVRDDGAGFDMAYKDKLFGPFQRLHGMSEFEGTGIGLATVQRIIHRHGGHIWAEGAVEGGATFYFTLSDTSAAPHA